MSILSPSTTRHAPADDRGAIVEQVVRIDVHTDRLIIRFKSASKFLEQFPTQANRENILRNREFLAGNTEF